MKFMLLISSPPDFDSWSSAQKLDRYERVVEWHDYMAALSPSVVTHVWGSHQILNHREPSPTKEVFVAVVEFDKFEEFDRFMYEDPLRDVSRYLTVMLTDLDNDWVDDIRRLEEGKAQLFGEGLVETEDFQRLRSRFKQAPDFVGKYEFIAPKNLPVPYHGGSTELRTTFAEKPVEILIYGMNLTEFMEWDDARKLIHYEKVIWWHHHIAQMLSEGRVSHAWGTHDFCSNSTVSGNSAGAPVIYRAANLDEFDSMYRLDPLRQHGRFISVLLQPIEEQRALDVGRLDRARERLVARLYPR